MERIEFPPDYEFGLNQEEIALSWPELILDTNFHFTSLRRKGHNCVAYALKEHGKDLDMWIFAELYGIDKANLDISVNGYAEIFTKYYGYEKCEEGNIEEGFDKIVLFEDHEGDFVHVALQLENGNWTSKMGTYEDIEHYSVDAISKKDYGTPRLYMKKNAST